MDLSTGNDIDLNTENNIDINTENHILNGNPSGLPIFKHTLWVALTRED